MTTVTTDPRHGRMLVWQKALQRWLTRSSADEILPSLYLGGYVFSFSRRPPESLFPLR